MRSLRTVILLRPFEFPLALCLFVVALIFTVFPEALSHAPISFEDRGIVHHVWHYSLLLGSGLALFGLFRAGDLGLKVEFVGLLVMGGAIAENSIAIATAGDQPAPEFSLSIRVAVVTFIAIRCWSIIAKPVIRVKADDRG